MSINKVILVGNVGKDPMVRYFDKGVAKATFPLATSETYTNQQGETITSTEWHNIVLWRALAEVAEKTVKKGAQVYIVGKIKTRSYVDKDGNNKYITEILADTMFLFDKKQGSVPSSSTTSHESEFGDTENQNNDKATGKSTPLSANDISDKVIPVTGRSEIDDTKMNSTFDEGTITSKNEDDLPF
jgi:single-strand DNA-binding protein